MSIFKKLIQREPILGINKLDALVLQVAELEKLLSSVTRQVAEAYADGHSAGYAVGQIHGKPVMLPPLVDVLLDDEGQPL